MSKYNNSNKNSSLLKSKKSSLPKSKSSSLLKSKKSSLLKTKSKSLFNNNLNNNFNNNLNDTESTITFSIINSNFSKNKKSKTSKKNENNNKTFLTKIRTIKKNKVSQSKKDKVIEFLDDNLYNLRNKKIIQGKKLDSELFNDDKLNCICSNLHKLHLEEECKCNTMKTYSSQGKSGASIHSIMCKIESKKKQINNEHNYEKQILKVVPLNNYYIKLRTETKKYMFVELDGFTIQTLINTYVYNELPLNTVKILNSGVCNKNKTTKGKYQGYNLMEEANLGSGRDFLTNIINGKLDSDFNITNDKKRYITFINGLLQIILIIGHLQSSSLEFFHGDYKPENVFVSKCPLTKTKYFKYNVFGKSIKVKNLGFAVLIADFDRSSMTLNSYYKNTDKKYRLISPILFKPLLTNYVNNIIKDYGDIDPDNYKEDIKIKKLFISHLIPRKMDPTITVLRSAGVKLYRDFDLYTFFIRLIENEDMRNYIVKHQINDTLMNFMSSNFRSELFNMPVKNISLNESAYIVVELLNKLKEPLPLIFNHNYINSLKNLNYKLFDM